MMFKEIGGKRIHIEGCRKGEPDLRTPELHVSWTQRLKMPLRNSLRSKIRGQLDDQAQWGSCVAHSWHKVAEYLRVKAGLPFEELSRGFVWNLGRIEQGQTLAEDSGLKILIGAQVLVKYGICAEKFHPYDIPHATAMPTEEARADAQRNKLLFYCRCPSVPTVCASIDQGFPVVIGFNCPEAMWTPEVLRSGVIPMPDDRGFRGRHSVLITGYDRLSERFEFLNWWGDDFGDGGYGTIPFAYLPKAWADEATSARLGKFQ